MKRGTGGVEVELTKGDITRQPDCDVVVNAANAELMPGGGVAGAIHRAAGPGLAGECRPLAPIAPGEAVVTDAHGLPNRAVIHVLGPVYGRDRLEEELLAACYRNALRLADESGFESIAFPAVSTGAFGYPLDEAAGVALGTVADTVGELEDLRRVRFVLFSDRELGAFEEALDPG